MCSRFSETWQIYSGPGLQEDRQHKQMAVRSFAVSVPLSHHNDDLSYFPVKKKETRMIDAMVMLICN